MVVKGLVVRVCMWVVVGVGVRLFLVCEGCFPPLFVLPFFFVVEVEGRGEEELNPGGRRREVAGLLLRGVPLFLLLTVPKPPRVEEEAAILELDTKRPRR